MSYDQVKTRLEAKMSEPHGLKARFQFDFGDDGVILIDTNDTPLTVSEEEGEADVTLSCSIDVLQGILDGTQDPNFAFMTGKLKVRGSMGLALKLNSLLED